MKIDREEHREKDISLVMWLVPYAVLAVVAVMLYPILPSFFKVMFSVGYLLSSVVLNETELNRYVFSCSIMLQALFVGWFLYKTRDNPKRKWLKTALSISFFCLLGLLLYDYCYWFPLNRHDTLASGNDAGNYAIYKGKKIPDTGRPITNRNQMDGFTRKMIGNDIVLPGDEQKEAGTESPHTASENAKKREDEAAGGLSVGDGK